MNKILSYILFLFLVLSNLTGCDWRSPKNDPCAIISEEEIEAIIGVPVKRKGEVGKSGTTCFYDYKLANSPQPYHIQIKISDFRETRELAKERFERFKWYVGYENAKAESVSGVGDDAFWDLRQLSFRALKGDIIVEIYFYTVTSISNERASVDNNFAREAGIKIGTIVVNRLK